MRRDKKKNKKDVSKLQVRNMIRSEMALTPYKEVYGVNRLAIQAGGFTWFSMPLPAYGTQYNNRVGDAIEVVESVLRFTAIVADVANSMRCCIFQFNGVQSVTPTDAGTFMLGPTAAYDTLSPRKFFQKNSRYHCLLDTMIVLCSNSSKAMISRELSLPVKIRRLGFDIGTSNPITGQIWVALCSDSAIAPHPAFDYYWTLKFRDV